MQKEKIQNLPTTCICASLISVKKVLSATTSQLWIIIITHWRSQELLCSYQYTCICALFNTCICALINTCICALINTCISHCCENWHFEATASSRLRGAPAISTLSWVHNCPRRKINCHKIKSRQLHTAKVPLVNFFL